MAAAPRIAVTLLAVTAGAAGAWWFWLRPSEPPTWLGYIEAEPIYLAAPTAGTLTSLPVRRGGRIAAGQQAFTLDDTTTAARLAELHAELDAAESRLDDMRHGKRAEERAVTLAQTEAAAAEEDQAEREHRRVRTLADNDFVSRSQLDLADARLRAMRANRRAMMAEQTVDRLPARRDQIAAAEAAVGAVHAQIAAQMRASQEIAPRAPRAALVEQTYFNPGEWVPANTPVVALLEDGRRKVRFFVPQADLPRARPGREIRIDCDGCAGPVRARIDYVAPRAEFTPPVIYSDKARAKLVFQVEAAVTSPQLLPGQPVRVWPTP
jgi:HlyD family secretion protein